MGSDSDPAISDPGSPAAVVPVPHRWLALVVLSLAQLMDIVDNTIINIALPTAQDDLGFSVADRQWLVTGYALTFGSLLLIGGRLSDLVGRKTMFMLGVGGFAVASAIGGAAPGYAVLLGARIAQGAFAAMLAPAALSLLSVTFSDNPKDRAKAFGVFGAISGAGGAIGLLLGGVLTEGLSWRWCLYVNLVFAVLALIAFVVIERRAAHPLLPPGVVLDRGRGASYLTLAIAGAGTFAVFLFLTYYLQQNLGLSPIMTGLAFLPMIGCVVLGAAGVGSVLMPRVGPRPLVPAGALLAAVGLVLLVRIGPETSYAGAVLPSLLIMGVGFGLIFSAVQNAATAGVTDSDAGVASSLVNASQQIGGSIGTAVFSSLAILAATSYSRRYGAADVEQATLAGYHLVFWVAAAVFAVAAAVAAALYRSGPAETAAAP